MTTIVCDKATDPAEHSECYGYVAPLVYGTSRPCHCACHTAGNVRDYQAAERKARGSFER